MIVGHKTDTYLTVQRRDHGGHFIVIKHAVVNELHATKGWRTIVHRQAVYTMRGKQLPTTTERLRHTTSTFKRSRPKKERVDYQFPNEAARQRALMRHGWYRRQKEKEARAAATEAWQQAAQ